MKNISRMYRKERKEHPTLPKTAVLQIVKDHMKVEKKRKR